MKVIPDMCRAYGDCEMSFQILSSARPISTLPADLINIVNNVPFQFHPSCSHDMRDREELYGMAVY